MLVTSGQAVSSAFARRRPLRDFEFEPLSSGIEQELANTLTQHTRVQWEQQIPIETRFATFYLDMGCRVRSDRVVAVECDGGPYHLDSVRDFCRDALILGTKRVSCVYRLEAWAIRKRFVDWLKILCVAEPELFSEERAATINELSCAYDKHVGSALKNRTMHFITRLVFEMEGVQRVLRLAEEHQNPSFNDLVALVRKCQHVSATA